MVSLLKFLKMELIMLAKRKEFVRNVFASLISRCYLLKFG